MKHLYIVRGLPGSGKSTFAKTLAEGLKAPHVEEDMFLYNMAGEYQWSPVRMINAVELCLHTTMQHMYELEQNIVVSNVFETDDMLRPYIDSANRHNYEVTVMVIENRRGGENIHNVPPEAIEEMRENFKVRL